MQWENMYAQILPLPPHFNQDKLIALGRAGTVVLEVPQRILMHSQD